MAYFTLSTILQLFGVTQHAQMVLEGSKPSLIIEVLQKIDQLKRQFSLLSGGDYGADEKLPHGTASLVAKSAPDALQKVPYYDV